jgi:hypothetical protein
VNATLTIDSRECDTLRGLLSRRLLILVGNPSALAKAEGLTVPELYERLADDLRLMEDIGWASEADRESVGLTMPREKLAETLRRLCRDARRAPFSMRHEREPKESVDERWRRFRQAVEVCEELLDRLDSLAREREEATPLSMASPEQVASHELSPYRPVTDGFILAAVERAVLHEQEGEVLTSVLTHYLGFESKPATNRLLFPRLEELRWVGLLTTTERRGEPFWSLTSVGRERLAEEREAGEVGDLPESPQHRAWRHAREQAAVRIDEFRHEQTDALGAADRLLSQYQPSLSQDWLALSERLRLSTWRMASAIHCLEEWFEPRDELPDVDENPGPRPGRRSIWAWDRDDARSKGQRP